MSKNKHLVTLDYAKSLIEYDRETGLFTWLVDRNKNIKKGSIANRKRRGYIQISLGIKNTNIVVDGHHLAWLFEYGEFPKKWIDHVNRQRDDNRIENLREATPSENHQNKGAQKNSKTGVKGVCFRNGRYVAQICDGKKRRHLGQFKDLESAARRYSEEVAKIHPNFGTIN